MACGMAIAWRRGRAGPAAVLHAINFHHMSGGCWRFIYSSLAGFTLKSIAGTWRKGKSLLTGGGSEGKWKRGFYFFIFSAKEYAEWASGCVGEISLNVRSPSGRRIFLFFYLFFHTNAVWKPCHVMNQGRKAGKVILCFARTIYLFEAAWAVIDHCSIWLRCPNHHPSLTSLIRPRECGTIDGHDWVAAPVKGGTRRK